MKDAQEMPFKRFGQELRTLRQKLQETPADVSGAVEIDEAMLQRYEEGRERPSEEILNLLISHFAMPDDDAATLWRLAGYEFPLTCGEAALTSSGRGSPLPAWPIPSGRSDRS